MSAVKKTLMLGISTVVLLVLCTSAFLMPKTAKATEIILPEIENGSFEEVAPLGWEISAIDIDGQKHGLTNQVFYDGENSYQLKQNAYTIKNADYINVDAGSEYIVGVKVLCSNLNATYKLSVQAFDQNGEYLCTTQGATNNVSMANTWQDLRLNFESQESACKIKMLIEIDSNIADVCIDYAYAHKDFVHTLDGASINLETTTSALAKKGQLCFAGKIDKETLDKFESVYDDVEIGFAVTPTKRLNSVGEFSFESFAKSGLNDYIIHIEKGQWSNLYTIEKDGFYEFECALSKIETEHLKENLSFRVYIKYSQDRQERCLYSNYNEQVNSRSVYMVAVMAKADTQNYIHYSQGQKEKIDAYIEGREPDLKNMD